MKKDKLMTIADYVKAVNSFRPKGKGITKALIYQRERQKEINFIVSGEPIYKINATQYPPKDFIVKKAGRK